MKSFINLFNNQEIFKKEELDFEYGEGFIINSMLKED